MNESSPPLLSGRYQVIRLVGEGGMGAVYVAHDRNLDCDVVIKMPRRSALEERGFAERFDREIRSLVKLAHPHIVKIQDVGSHDGVPFCVMQYLSGGSLQDRAMPADVSTLETWLTPVAAALDFVFQQGYLHRDVKPANILFDAHGNAYVSDFGVAKVLAGNKAASEQGPHLTGANMVVGTPEYLAPELIMGDTDVDGRADQYALAMTVYEVLAGQLPFGAATPSAVLVKQMTTRLPPLRSLAPTVPEGVARAVERALSKDKKHRFADCAEFAATILRPAGAPSRSMPPPPPLPKTGGRAAPASQGARMPPPPPVPGTRLETAAPPPAPGRGTRIESPAPPPVGGTRLETAAPPPAPGRGTRIESAPPPPAKPGRALERTQEEWPEEEAHDTPVPKSTTGRGEPAPPRPSTGAAARPKSGQSSRPQVKTRKVEASGSRGLLVVGVLVLVVAVVGGAFAFRSWQKSKGQRGVGGPAAFNFKPLDELTVRPGSAQQVAVRVARLDYEGPIRLSCVNKPAGLTVSEPTIAEGETQVTLNVESIDAAPGRVTIRVTGQTDRGEQTVDLPLNILPPPSMKAQLPATLLTLYLGDDAAALTVGLVRQECGDQPAQFQVDNGGMPEGILLSPQRGEVAPGKDSFDISVQALARAEAGKAFNLPITVTLQHGQRTFTQKLDASFRIEKAPVKLGKVSVTRTSEGFVISTPILRNGFRGPVSVSVEGLPDHFAVHAKEVKENLAQLILRRKGNKGGLSADVRIYPDVGGVRLPEPARFSLNLESAVVATLAGPAGLKRLHYVAGGRRLVALSSGSHSRVVVWAAEDWSRPHFESPVGQVLAHPENKWFLCLHRAGLSVWTTETDQSSKPKVDNDPAHLGLALSEDGNRLVMRSERVAKERKILGGVLVGGVVPVEDKIDRFPGFSFYETSNWKSVATVEKPVPVGNPVVVGRGRWLVEQAPERYTFRVLKVGEPAKELYTLSGREFADVLLSSDDEYLVGLGDDGVVRVLEPETKKVRFSTPTPVSRARAQARFLPGGNLLLVTVPGELCSVWDLRTGKKTRDLEGKPSGTIELGPDGKLARDDQHVWSLDTGKVVYTLQGGRLLAFTSDSKRVLAAEGGTVSGVDLSSGIKLFSVKTHSRDVVAAALGADGKTVAAGDAAGEIVVVEVAATKG